MYVYDTETGYYYLTTRYYDPETGRFLNADGYISTGETLTGYNMFAYCCDNPVHYKDVTGNRRTDAVNSLCNGSEADNIRTAYLHEQERVKNQEVGITSYVHRVKVNDTHTMYVCDSETTAIPFKGKVDEHFSIAVDYRESDNILLPESCNIKGLRLKYNICSAIREYHELHPTATEWDRNPRPMMEEWVWHNIFAKGAKVIGSDKYDRFASVDLDEYPLDNSTGILQVIVCFIREYM